MSEQEVRAFLNEQDCQELAQSMTAKYRIAMNQRAFSVKASEDQDKVEVHVLLKNEDDSFYYPVSARIVVDKDEMSNLEAAMFLIDYIDTYFEEFLLEQEESIYLPIDWAEHQYEGIDFQVKGEIRNRKLENMADEWIKKHSDEDHAEVDYSL